MAGTLLHRNPTLQHFAKMQGRCLMKPVGIWHAHWTFTGSKRRTLTRCKRQPSCERIWQIPARL